jgi:hypothetical protein
VTTIPLRHRLPGAFSNLPGRRDPDIDPGDCSPAFASGQPPRRPYSVLLPVGFALPPALPPARCALTAPFHPCRPHPFILAARRQERWDGGLFSVALSLGSRPPDVIRHRMSMEPGLSSRTHLSAAARAAVQPTDGLGMGCKRADVKPPRVCPSAKSADHEGPQAGSAESRGASRAASRALSVSMVETSMMPSTRFGRK